MTKSVTCISVVLIFIIASAQLSFSRQPDTVVVTVHETIRVTDQPVEVLPPVEIKINEDVSVDDGQSRLPSYLYDPAGKSPMRPKEEEIRFLRKWLFSSA